ncbi:zinc-binding dehydrogenase-like protein 2 [Elsinoe australis]|uniref:Zinc-binding dehydrogenase-like protein 2 n=1 Tax=Elsinoe australis TaxID=40998 RepID=A0A4U7AW70_9PEZI|nr:zinc-binding dehydrogenase-like protein 2 [Elsinoe australis]
MSPTMLAARFHGPHDIRIDHIPLPSPTPSQVLLQISWAGICGSDLHEYLIGPQTIPRPDKPHPITNSTLPCPMGHEFCGVVAPLSPAQPQKSANGLPLVEGAKVIVDPRLYCAREDCENCAKGATNACPKWGFHGLSGCCGGFSQYVAVEARMCYVLPAETDLSFAALIEPLAVAWHAVKVAGVGRFEGRKVLIVGGGPIGIALVYVLRVFGCEMVVVSEPTELRRSQDEKVADVVLDPTKVKVAEECKRLTNGSGVDVAFDAAGVERGLQDGVDALKYGGTYVNIAGWETPFTIPWFPFMLKDMRVQGSMAYNDEDFAETVQAYIDGKFKGVESMVTSRISLKDTKEKGFEELINNKDYHIKIMISPHDNAS